MVIKLKYVFVISLVLLMSSAFLSCDSGQQDTSNDIFDSIVNTNKVAEIPPELLSSILKSVPSPIEMSAIIQESGAPFQKDFLNSTDNDEKYTTAYSRALNLGVYGADMGYLNMYEQTLYSIGYLETIKGIADDLKVGQFFDFHTIKRLASNSKNLDSVIYISTSSFDRMSTYLKDQNRSHVSALILIGGWIEGLYLATQIVHENSSEKLVERIGEQKIALNDIMVLLSVYENNPAFSDLVKDVQKLKAVYDNVKITYTVGEPVTKIVDGMLIVEDNTTSEVEISEMDVKSIISIVSDIRTKMI